MNNDFLRVGAEEESEVVDKSYSVKDDVVEDEKLTVYNAIKYKADNVGYVSAKKSYVKFSFMLLFVSFANFIIYFIAYLVKDIRIVYLSATLTAVSIPIISIAFIKTTAKPKITASESALCITTGVFVFLAIKIVVLKIGELIGEISWYDFLISRTAEIFAVLIAAFLFVKIARKDDIPSAIFISVCIYSGFYAARNAYRLFDFLLAGIDKTGFVAAKEYLNSVYPRIYLLAFGTIFRGIISLSVSIVNGFSIGVLTAPVKADKRGPSSFLFLVALTVVLDALTSFPSIIIPLFIIFNLLYFGIAVFLSARVFNYALSKVKPIKK